MKKIYALLVLVMATNTQGLLGQELTLSEPIPEIREKFIAYHGGTALYYNHYSDFSNSLNTLEYLSVDASNSEGKVRKYTPKIDVEGFNKGSIKRILVNADGYLYEVHQLGNVSGAGQTLLVKREIQTLKETKRLLLDDAQVVFCNNDRERIFLIGERHYYQIDFDLKVIMDRSHDLFSNREADVRVDTAQLDNNSNVMMSILVSNPEKFSLLGSSKPRRSSLYFAVFGTDGETSVINPDLPSAIQSRYFRYNYDAGKDELAALFITNDEPKKNEFIGQGFKYVYIRWGRSGEIIATNEHRFIFSEFRNDELARYSKIAKFDPEKFGFKYLDYTTPGYIEFLANGNVVYMTDILNGLPGSIFNSKLIFVVTSEGELLWSGILPFSNSDLYRKSSYLVKGGELHFLTFDYLDNYKGGNYEPVITSGKYNGLNTGLTERVLDLKNGEVVSNRLLATSKSEQFIPYKFISRDSESVLFKFSYTQKNLERYLLLNY